MKLPMKPCRVASCKNITRNDNGYCDNHQDRARKPSTSKYKYMYNKAWRSYAARFLAAHPYCTACAARGQHVLATEVDHVKPHQGDYGIFWDKSNHQGLCKSCHSKKTISEGLNAYRNNAKIK